MECIQLIISHLMRGLENYFMSRREVPNATWVFCDKPKEKDIPVSDDTQSPKSYVERFIDNLNEEK